MPSAGNRRRTHNKNSAVAEMAAQSCTFSCDVRGTSLYLTLKHFFPVTSENITINHIGPYKNCQKLWFYGHVFVAESLGLTSTTVTQLALISTKFGEITPNNGDYVVQGHSRSPISVPIQSGKPVCHLLYWIILTYILSHTVSKLWCSMNQIFAFEWGTSTPF